MTTIATRAVISNQIARRKLALSKKSDHALDDSTRQKLHAALRADESLTFLADAVDGKLSPDSIYATNESNSLGHHNIESDDEPPQLPTKKPRFISKRHHTFLGRYFTALRPFRPEWYSSYIGGTQPGWYTTYLHSPSIDSSGRVNEIFDGPDLSVWTHALNESILVCQVVTSGQLFTSLVVFSILIAGILVGMQTYPSIQRSQAISSIDLCVQLIFTLECILKILQEGCRPYLYWTGPQYKWNNFDFWLVLLLWVPLRGNVAFIRLIRLMRLLKLVGKVRQLQVIVEGLIKGLSSVTYILLLLVLIFYLFAVVGVVMFRNNDPFHFGSIGVAMITLFRVATLESWSNVMYINWYGCDSQSLGVVGWYHGINSEPPYSPTGSLGTRPLKLKTLFGEFPDNVCWKPERNPLTSAVFFVMFVLVAAFVCLSLFVGAVCGGMSESIDAFKHEEAIQRAKRDAIVREIARQENRQASNGYSLDELRDAFEACDQDGSGEIDAFELAECMTSMGEEGITEEVAECLISAVTKNIEGTLGFHNYVVLMTDGEVDIAKMKAEAAKPLTPHQVAQEKREHALALSLLARLRSAWNLDSDELLEREHYNQTHPIASKYLLLAYDAERLVSSSIFTNVMLGIICLAAVLVGVETEARSDSEFVLALDNTVLFVFIIEIIVKLVAYGKYPYRFFWDRWNCFDFAIVALCCLFQLPFLPNVDSILAMLRLLRLLRVLKLVKALPELKIIIDALISGFGSIAFVTIIMFIFFYVFANIAILLFSRNDPDNFASLEKALVTLFRVATLDSWSAVMYINVYGCDRWAYSLGRKFSEKQAQKEDHANCNHPEAFGWIAVLFFVVFVLIGGQVLMTLFIGIVVTSQEEAKAYGKEELVLSERLEVNRVTLHIDHNTMELYKSIFVDLDVNCEKRLDRQSLRPLVQTLPLIRRNPAHNLQYSSSRELEAEIETDVHGKYFSRMDVDKLITVVDEHQAGSIDLGKFIVIVDFLRRAEKDPSIIQNLREIYRSATANRKRNAVALQVAEAAPDSVDAAPPPVVMLSRRASQWLSTSDMEKVASPVERSLATKSGEFVVQVSTEFNDESPTAENIARLEDACCNARQRIFEHTLKDLKKSKEASDENERMLRAKFIGLRSELSSLEALDAHITSLSLKGDKPTLRRGKSMRVASLLPQKPNTFPKYQPPFAVALTEEQPRFEQTKPVLLSSSTSHGLLGKYSSSGRIHPCPDNITEETKDSPEPENARNDSVVSEAQPPFNRNSLLLHIPRDLLKEGEDYEII